MNLAKKMNLDVKLNKADFIDRDFDKAVEMLEDGSLKDYKHIVVMIAAHGDSKDHITDREDE